MFNNKITLLLLSAIILKVLSVPVKDSFIEAIPTSTNISLPEKANDHTLCYFPDLESDKKRECWNLKGYFHKESIKMKESGECEEFTTCFLPYSPQKDSDMSQCVKFTYDRNKESIYCSILFNDVPIADTYSFMETIEILDSFYDHFHYTPATTDGIKQLPVISSTISIKSIPTVTTASTKSTKSIPTITITSTKTLPSSTSVNVTLKDIETITEEETITVTPQSASSTIINDDSNCANKWYQCGGVGFTGPNCCKSGLTCHQINKYYSYCQ